MTINEFVKSMADAGFEFEFRAQSGDLTIVGESIMCADGKCTITKRNVRSTNESRAMIRDMFKKPTAKQMTNNFVAAVNDYAKSKG